MNNKERKQFWDTLISLDGKDITAETSLLRSIIKYPKHIYRFRSVNSNSLDGLRLNKLYFSSANKYDDPFDSYSHIDWNSIFAEINQSFNNQDSRQWAFNMMHAICGISPEDASRLLDMKSSVDWCKYGAKIVEDIRKYIQANELSICFTEEGLNEVLWLKYADDHYGFVLEYDLVDDSSFICGKEEKCIPCTAAKINYPLYPIYYSNKKYNATEYVKSSLKRIIIESFPPPLRDYALNSLPNMTWQRERISLIKKKCHWYDKEWRMIYPNDDMSMSIYRPFVCWKPSSVIIGLRATQADKNMITACVKEAKVPHVYQCFINKKDKLDKQLIY